MMDSSLPGGGGIIGTIMIIAGPLMVVTGYGMDGFGEILVACGAILLIMITVATFVTRKKDRER